uniref:Nucleophosmin n=1 Tax=Oreochromis niloticus TaxID=8128 RepID=I3IYS3_ORENI
MEDDISDMSRPQMYLFGCTLKSDKREFKVDLDGDETEQQLSLKAVCLGAEAEDKFHMVEVEGLTYDGKTTKVPLAVLKPSVLPSMSLGGFEITPPVTFRLQSGSGPKKLKMDSDDDDDDDDEEDSDEDDDEYLCKFLVSYLADVLFQPPAPGKDKQQPGPSKSLPEIKSKLSTAAKEGKPLPKTEPKFENYLRSAFKISDKQVSNLCTVL